jgi:hypothetical protein
MLLFFAVARNRETHYEDTIMSGQEQVDTHTVILGLLDNDIMTKSRWKYVSLK